MGKQARAIDAFPPKQVKRKGIARLPVQLVGEEILHAAALENLRQRGRVAEDVGQPAGARANAELLPEEADAEEHLPNKRFT